MNKKIKWIQVGPEPRHETKSTKRGNYIIWSCAQCPDFLRIMNWKTGRHKTTGDTPGINHFGQHGAINEN